MNHPANQLSIITFYWTFLDYVLDFNESADQATISKEIYSNERVNKQYITLAVHEAGVNNQMADRIFLQTPRCKWYCI